MSSGFLRGMFLSLGIIVLIFHNIEIYPWMLDDSFISFRYAENLVSGHGLVYNPGEIVEGYTCFLWVILLAFGKALGFSTPEFSQFLGSLFIIATVVLIFFAHRFSKNIDSNTSATAALFLGTCGIFTPWAISGMEVGLFTFLLSLSILLYIVAGESGGKRTFPFLGLILAALALTRPEGVLIFSTVSLTQLVIRRDVKGAFTIAIAFGLIYVPYFLWRYSYYGFLLPNTFYAKVGSSMDQVIRGMIYAIRFAFAASLLILFSLFAVPTLKRTKLLILLHVIGAYAIYVVLVGGDIMPAFRFFTPILPLLCIMAAFGLYSVVHKPRLAILLAFGIAASNFVLFRIHPQMYRYIRSDTVATDGKEAGLWLKEHAPPDSVLATNTGGSIPYYSRLKTIDMLGLNDVHIAHRRSPEVGKGPAGHEKGDGAYVLSRMPEYIQFGSSLGSTRPLFLSDVEIYQDPSFHDQYVLSSHPLEFGKQVILYERRNP